MKPWVGVSILSAKLRVMVTRSFIWRMSVYVARCLLVDVERLYKNRFDEPSKIVKQKIWRVIVEDYLQRWVGADDVVLDIGCGYGEFLNHLRCGRKIGLDFNPDSERHLDPSVEFRKGSASDLSFLPDESVNVIFTSNLLEHLSGKSEMEGLLAECHRVLAPGASFIALGPNIRFLGGSYWDFWDHHVPISDRSIVEVLEYTGFEIKLIHPRFLPYTTQSRFPQSPLVVSLYLKFPPIWRVLGKQFLVRAEKQ